MYVRANMLTADPAKIDGGIRYVQERVMPALDGIPGSRGLSMSVNRETGKGALVTWWADLESLRASEEKVAPLRAEGAEILGGTLAPRVLEVVDRQVRQIATPGCWNRVTALDMSSGDVDKAIETFRTSTIPALEAMDGFCAATLSVDRESAQAVAVTVWRDREALEASRERASGLRDEVVGKAQGRVTSVDEYEIVLFSIRPD